MSRRGQGQGRTSRRLPGGATSFDPNTTSPEVWYRETYAAGMWTDRSGHGRDSTPQAAPSNPTQVAGVINGQPVVRFAGTNGLLMPAGCAVASGPVSPVTVWMVSKTTAGAGYATIAIFNKFGVYARLAAGKWGVYATGDRPSATFNDAQFQQMMVLATGDNSNATYRTNKTAETVAIGAYNNAGLFIGTDTVLGADNMAGDIAEIMMWKRVLSASEIASIEAYGSARYGI